MSQKRIEVKTVSGETLSILIEYKANGYYTFPYTAVLNDWDEGCKYANGKTPREAVEELLDLIDAEAAAIETSHLNVFFPESLPMLLRRQAG